MILTDKLLATTYKNWVSFGSQEALVSLKSILFRL